MKDAEFFTAVLVIGSREQQGGRRIFGGGPADWGGGGPKKRGLVSALTRDSKAPVPRSAFVSSITLGRSLVTINITKDTGLKYRLPL